MARMTVSASITDSVPSVKVGLNRFCSSKTYFTLSVSSPATFPFFPSMRLGPTELYNIAPS